MTRRSGGVMQPPVARPSMDEHRPLVVEAIYRPKPGAKERLVDLLAELLDEASHSRGV